MPTKCSVASERSEYSFLYGHFGSTIIGFPEAAAVYEKSRVGYFLMPWSTSERYSVERVSGVAGLFADKSTYMTGRSFSGSSKTNSLVVCRVQCVTYLLKKGNCLSTEDSTKLETSDSILDIKPCDATYKTDVLQPSKA